MACERCVKDALTYMGGSMVPHDAGGRQVSLSPRLISRLKIPYSAGTSPSPFQIADSEISNHPILNRVVEMSRESGGLSKTCQFCSGGAHGSE